MGWLRLLGPEISPVMKYLVYSPAWAQIWPTEQRRLHDLAPARRAHGRTAPPGSPSSRFWPAMWSATVAPTGVGIGAPAAGRADQTRPRPARSGRHLPVAASGPSGPKDELTA